jgi:adenine-specific DNA-methyltransferase
MAAINDLIKQIEDKALRDRLAQEVERISSNKKFGLVFEEHIPECTPIYSVSIKKGHFCRCSASLTAVCSPWLTVNSAH